MMRCLNCNMPAEKGALYCGHCGVPLLPAQSQVNLPADEIQLAWQIDQREHTEFGKVSMVELDAELFPRHTYPQTQIPHDESSSLSSPVTSSTQHIRAPYRSTTRRNIAFIVAILALLGVGIGAGLLALWQNMYIHTYMHQHMSIKNSAAPALVVSGTVSFHDSEHYPGRNDSLSIRLQGVPVPPAHSYYAAWLFDKTNEVFYPLGSLTKSGSSYVLDYTDSSQHRDLLQISDKVQITQETVQTSSPTGKLVASAQFPPQSSIYMNHLLVSSPTNANHSGLLSGLYAQTQTLVTQAESLRTTHGQTALQCVALNMITVLEGQRDSAVPLNAHICNAKHLSLLQERQQGLLMGKNGSEGYLQDVTTQASLTATQSDSTDAMRSGAQHIVIIADNIQQWLKQLDTDAHTLLKNPVSQTSITEMVTLANEANTGKQSGNDNLSGNKIDMLNQSQAGAKQTYLYGQSMTMLRLTH